MKKTLLLLIITVSLFIITGCAEEKSSKSADIPSIDNIPEEFKNIEGTYNITFFGSEITNLHGASNVDLFETYNNYYISNNCQKAQELFPDVINKNGKNKCDEVTQLNLLTNKAVIYIFDNQISFKAKLQAEGSITDKYLTYKYQYITSAPSNSLNGNEIKEYYYDNNNISDTAYEHSDNNYVITKLNDKTIQIDIFYYRKDIKLDTIFNNINVDTKNTYILEKIDNNTIELINNNDYPF